MADEENAQKTGDSHRQGGVPLRRERRKTDMAESPGDVKTTETTQTQAAKTEPKIEEVAQGGEQEEKPAPIGPPAGEAGKFKDLISQIEGLSALELSELVKALEERFGVSAAAPMMAAPAAGGAPAAPAEVAEEKTHYTVVLAEAGAQKIAVIKALREVDPNLGLKEAKEMTESVPKTVKENLPKAEAEEAKKKLEAAGAKIELK